MNDDEAKAIRDEGLAMLASALLRCPECDTELPPGPGREFDECPECHWVEGY